MRGDGVLHAVDQHHVCMHIADVHRVDDFAGEIDLAPCGHMPEGFVTQLVLGQEHGVVLRALERVEFGGQTEGVQLFLLGLLGCCAQRIDLIKHKDFCCVFTKLNQVLHGAFFGAGV